MKYGQRPSGKGTEFEAYREEKEQVQEIESLIEEDHPSDWSPRKFRVTISYIFIVLYPCILLIYYFNRHNWYKWGEQVCDSVSQWTNSAVYYYFNFYANYFDRFVPIGGTFLLLVGVDKPTTLKAIFFTAMSMHSRNIIRDWFEDNRPLYTSSNLRIPALNCNCSFGMPSGHVEGTTTLNFMLLYVCLLCSRTLSRSAKLCGVAVVLTTQFSMIMAMVYTGRHTIIQGSISLFNTAFWMSIMCVSDPGFTRFCRGFINGDTLSTIKVWLVAIGIYVLASAAWLIYLEPTLFNFKGNYQIRCFECTREHNLSMRLAMTKGFAISATSLGIVSGLTITRAKSLERNDNMLWDHFSCEGIARISFLFTLNLLNFTKLEIRSSEIDSYMFCSGSTFLSAFLFTVLFPKIAQCLRIQFKGDLVY